MAFPKFPQCSEVLLYSYSLCHLNGSRKVNLLASVKLVGTPPGLTTTSTKTCTMPISEGLMIWTQIATLSPSGIVYTVCWKPTTMSRRRENQTCSKDSILCTYLEHQPRLREPASRSKRKTKCLPLFRIPAVTGRLAHALTANDSKIQPRLSTLSPAICCFSSTQWRHGVALLDYTRHKL